MFQVSLITTARTHNNSIPARAYVQWNEKDHSIVKEFFNEFIMDTSSLDSKGSLPDFHQKSLQTLLEFPETKETDIATILAVHLFSQLAVGKGPTYMVSNDYSFKYSRCPCSNEDCKDDVLYGNTGIGSEYLFFGKPDIVVFPKGAGSCSVVVPKAKKKVRELQDWDDENEVQMVEVKKTTETMRNAANENQVASIAITFSFYQRIKQYRKRLPEPLHDIVSIIPTIAICKDSFDIYMYDTENDIFLRNKDNPIPLWKDDNESNLSITSIFTLWMILNHLTFRPKIPNKMKVISGSCGIAKEIDPHGLELIEKTLKMSSLKFMPVEAQEENVRKTKLIQFDQDSDTE